MELKMENDVGKIVEKYVDMIYRVAYINLKSKTDAEDITQEVLMKYLMNTKKFINEEHERNWIVKVTLNLCKNFKMSAWNRRVISIEEANIEFETAEQTRIFEELDSLKEKYRIVVQLFYFEDLPIETISKILGISKQNVKTRLNRARNELKKELGNDMKKGEIFYGKI